MAATPRVDPTQEEDGGGPLFPMWAIRAHCRWNQNASCDRPKPAYPHQIQTLSIDTYTFWILMIFLRDGSTCVDLGNYAHYLLSHTIFYVIAWQFQWCHATPTYLPADTSEKRNPG